MQSIYEEYYRIGYTCTNYDRAKPIIDLIDEERKTLMQSFTKMTIQQIDIKKRQLSSLESELSRYFKKTHAPLPRR